MVKDQPDHRSFAVPTIRRRDEQLCKKSLRDVRRSTGTMKLCQQTNRGHIYIYIYICTYAHVASSSTVRFHIKVYIQFYIGNRILIKHLYESKLIFICQTVNAAQIITGVTYVSCMKLLNKCKNVLYSSLQTHLRKPN